MCVVFFLFCASVEFISIGVLLKIYCTSFLRCAITVMAHLVVVEKKIIFIKINADPENYVVYYRDILWGELVSNVMFFFKKKYFDFR